MTLNVRAEMLSFIVMTNLYCQLGKREVWKTETANVSIPFAYKKWLLYNTDLPGHLQRLRSSSNSRDFTWRR